MTGRNQSLDVLRGLAVLAVTACHYPLWPWMSGGRYGVDLFFVLSGFLISGLLYKDLHRHGAIRVGRFLLRRGFKIYPPFYFFVALTALCFPVLRRYTAIECVFLQNYFLVNLKYASVWGHLWSLAVEEHFYLLLPPLLLFLFKYRKLSFVLPIAVALVGLSFMLRLWHSQATGSIEACATQLRMDELFAGVALGYLRHFARERFLAWSHWSFIFIGLGLLAPALFPSASPLQFTTTVTSVLFGSTFLVWWAVPRTLVGLGWLGEIGKHSYSIYLWQMVVALFWSSHKLTAVGWIAYMICAVAVGTAMSVIVEGPSLAVRDRLFPAQQEVATSSNAQDLPVEIQNPLSSL